jgi:hypothetical protein
VLENSVLWVVALLSLRYILPEERGVKNLLILSWTLFSFFGVLAGKAFYGHYFTQVIPGLSLLAAYTVTRFWRRPKRVLPALAIGAVLLGLSIPILREQVRFFHFSPDEISVRKYSSSDFVVARNIAQRIKQETVPGDPIFVWAAEAEIYFYSRTRCPSRYIYFYPLVIESPGVLERRRELMGELRQDQPKFIVWQDRTILNDPLYAFIRRHYRLYFVKYGWAVFRKK